MSAIFGVLNLDGRPAQSEELGRMRDALLAHGPDGDNIWMGGSSGMGHCLMRFTPEDSFERQPLAGGGKTMLVADARIDNRQELAARFGLSSREAAALPDSAFILKAYEKWDLECVRQLEGDYAFAVWDGRTQVLFAACAPAGERPLHYHSTPRSFAFATMPRGLLALQGVPRVLNEAKVADYLARTQRELDSTFYKGIHRLRGGHHLTVGPKGLKITRYWSPDPGRRIRFKNDEDYPAAFQELFDRVVADHLRSATPVGVLMSGGLDSSSVAVTAAGQLQPPGGRLAAYTEVPRAGFAGPVPAKRYGDETALVRAIARDNATINLHLVRTDGQYFLEDLNTFFAHAECPFRNPSNRVWWEAILRLAREQGNRVLLHGSMGNLTASWAGAGLLRELIREGHWKQALREARLTAGRGGSAWRLLATSGFLTQLPACLLGPLARWRGDPDNPPYYPLEWAPIRPDFVAEQGLRTHLDREFKAAYYTERAGKRAGRAEEATTQADFSALVSTGHRSMFGVDTRDPLGDRRILEFCLALPESQYRSGRETRRLIRRAMAERLPPEVLGCRAKGVQAADWRERQERARPRIAETLAAMERSPSACRILDTERLRSLFNTWPKDNRDEQKHHLDYKFTLQAGLMVGCFLMWFEQGG